jgi:signal transduction histidine kinase/CheY-like chemotaxis protein
LDTIPLQRRSRALIIGCAIAVLAAVSIMEAADLWWRYDATRKRAEERAANQTYVLTQYILGSFAVADTTLRQLAAQSPRIGGPSAPGTTWDVVLASARAAMPGAVPGAVPGSLSIADRDGIIRHSTLASIVGQPRRDHYIFRRLSTRNSDELVIDAPFWSDFGHRYVLPIGRRLATPSGEFDGIVATAYTPDVYQEFFKSIDVGRQGVISVFHPDGVVVFRGPSESNAIGQLAGTDPLLQAAQASGGRGSVTGPLSAGGPHFISAYATLQTPPLVVAVSLNRTEVLADWRAHAAISLLGLGALAATLGGMAFFLFRQMSARMQVEQELHEVQRLEAVRLRDNNERLADALEREQRARRDSEAAGRLKDEFLMTLSHELRTPLTAIHGWVRMLSTGVVGPEEQGRALTTIERNARAQTRLIDDLLDVSRAISGKLRLDARPVNVVDSVRSAIDTLTPALDAKSIRVETSFDHDAGTILADPDRVAQIVWNLLSNAIKFTPEDGVVRVAVTRAGTNVEITVTDSGIGIRAEFVPYVFERFRQADAGSRRRYGGLGLGLAIVRHLVELHGGTVTAESEGEGKGASFRVRLPARVPRGDSRPEQSGAASIIHNAAIARLDGIRVLVVDDEEDARQLFASIVRAAGAMVWIAASVADALRLLEDRDFDVLVSDIEMPDRDGYQLLEQARPLVRRRGGLLTVIAVTAYARSVDRQRALDAGFDWYLAKPVEPSELVTVIGSLAKARV